MSIRKCFFIGLTAALLVVVAVTTASANRLSNNVTRRRLVWTPVTGSSTSGTVIRCNVTMEEVFHSATIAKVRGALIGLVTGATFNACVGTNITVLAATLPWHVRYRGFTGTLPRLTGFQDAVIGLSVRLQPTGSIACLARSTVENPWVRTTIVEAGGRVTGVQLDPTATIPLEGFFCGFGGEMTFSGTGTAARSGTTVQDVTIRLI